MEKVWLDKLIGKTISGYERLPEFGGDESDHEVILHFTDGTSALIKAWARYADESGLDVEFVNMTALQYIEHLSKEAKLKHERAINEKILQDERRKKRKTDAEQTNALIAEIISEDE